jgi:hypothetical protein
MSARYVPLARGVHLAPLPVTFHRLLEYRPDADGEEADLPGEVQATTTLRP